MSCSITCHADKYCGLFLLAIDGYLSLSCCHAAINYLAFPAIVAMLAWLAISYPQQAANSVYYVLEFAKDHPVASSVSVVAAVGVYLGPDLLAGAAVTGVLVLLAAQLVGSLRQT